MVELLWWRSLSQERGRAGFLGGATREEGQSGGKCGCDGLAESAAFDWQPALDSGGQDGLERFVQSSLSVGDCGGAVSKQLVLAAANARSWKAKLRVAAAAVWEV